MHTFENQKITVTITDSIYQEMKDSAPITNDANELEIIVRGLVLSRAMEKLRHQDELQELIEKQNKPVPEHVVIEHARKILIEQYLEEHCKYNINEVLFRMDHNKPMSEGMHLQVEEAKAYAEGLLSPDRDQIGKEMQEYMVNYVKNNGTDSSPALIRQKKIYTLRLGDPNSGLGKQALEMARNEYYSVDKDRIESLKKRSDMTGWTIIRKK